MTTLRPSLSRHWVYREVQQVNAALAGTAQRAALERLRQEHATFRAELGKGQRRVAQAVVLDGDEQAEFAGAAFAAEGQP